jgi:hypothetical protein
LGVVTLLSVLGKSARAGVSMKKPNWTSKIC